MKNNAAVALATDHPPWPRNVTHHFDSAANNDCQRAVAFRAKAPASCFGTSVTPPSNLTMPSFRMNSLTQRVGNALPSAASFCIQHGAVKINFWSTSCCACQTHVGKRASNSSTRTLQKRWFDFRFFRFRSSVLRVGRARNFFGNQVRQLGMGQRLALQCGAVGTCCFRGLDVPQNMFFRCQRGEQFLQFKLSHVQLVRLVSVGRMRIGSSSLLICSSEAFAVKPKREKVCEPSQPKLSNSVEETSEEASPQLHPSASPTHKRTTSTRLVSI